MNTSSQSALLNASTEATWTASPCLTCARSVLGFWLCKGIRIDLSTVRSSSFGARGFRPKKRVFYNIIQVQCVVEKLFFASSADAECTVQALSAHGPMTPQQLEVASHAFVRLIATIWQYKHS